MSRCLFVCLAGVSIMSAMLNLQPACNMQSQPLLTELDS
jgi:hypothetical protein